MAQLSQVATQLIRATVLGEAVRFVEAGVDWIESVTDHVRISGRQRTVGAIVEAAECEPRV